MGKAGYRMFGLWFRSAVRWVDSVEHCPGLDFKNVLFPCVGSDSRLASMTRPWKLPGTGLRDSLRSWEASLREK